MESLLLLAIALGLIAMKAVAVVDCLRRPAAAFPAHDKLTKPVWTAITVAALVVDVLFFSPMNLLSIAGTVAAIVYLVDVKPAVSGTGG